MRSILKRFTAYVCMITLMVSGLTFYKNDIDIKAATTETVAQDDNLKNQSGLYSNKDQVWAEFEGGWSTYFQILTTDITNEAGNVTGTNNQGASGESWSTSLNDLTVKLNETNGSQWSAQAKSPVISDFTKGLYYYYEISITTDKDLTIGAKLVNSDFIYYTIPAGEGVIKGVLE